ncbi:MAG: hypothetical protein HYU88_07495 [Chloroflexi bacterium]|nr:hypothetical protein [Chloroflexota bacterium]
MLHQESAGNPLFITEMLHSLGEAGFLRHDAQGYLIPPDPATFSQSAVALPRSLRDLIAGRLVRLSAAARQALAVAATLGPDLDDDLLQRTIGWDEEQTVAALEELLQAHLLVEAPGGSYRFSHEKIRGVAYADLAEARRTLLHRRAGEALAARHAAPDLLAYHFARGKAWRRAHQYAVVAAERAVEAHANREATVHYTTALEAATHLSGEVEPSRLAAIHEARGRVWLGMSEYAAAIDDFERALEEARRAGDERRALSAQRYLALARFWHHEPAARALGYAEGALAEARRLGDRHEVAACSAVLAAILVTRGRLREGISRVEEAIRVGRETGDDYLVADAVGTLGMAHGWRGSFHQARSELAQSLELARVRHWGLLIPRALFFTGLNTAMAGDYQAALDFLTECRRYAEEMNDRWWLARLPNTFGWVYQELYDIGTSRRYDAEGVEAARESPWPEPLGNALVNLAMDWLLSGELGHAQDAFDQAAELLGRDETMQWRWETRLWLGLAEWWLARCDAEHALAFAGRALTLARQTRAAKNAMKARRLQGLALLASGHLDTATNALTRAARLADCLNAPRLRWETHALLARLGQQAGRDAEAERHIRIAGGLVDAVARTLKDEALRARFLGAEPLRDLFAGLR